MFFLLLVILVWLKEFLLVFIDLKAEVIVPVFDAVAKTLTFETDRFSTYAVVYTDVVNIPPTEETTPPTEEATSPETETAPPATTPATGDDSRHVVWVACMFIGILGVTVLLLDTKRRCTR